MKFPFSAAMMQTVLIVIPATGQTARPQPKATPPVTSQGIAPGDVIRIESELVTLTATVTDSRGRYVANLKESDFTVFEDGVRQDLAFFGTGDRVPISLGIVFDTRGSMIDKIEGVRDAIEHFVKSVATGDEIFLIRFARSKSSGWTAPCGSAPSGVITRHLTVIHRWEVNPDRRR